MKLPTFYAYLTSNNMQSIDDIVADWIAAEIENAEEWRNKIRGIICDKRIQIGEDRQQQSAAVDG